MLMCIDDAQNSNQAPIIAAPFLVEQTFNSTVVILPSSLRVKYAFWVPAYFTVPLVIAFLYWYFNPIISASVHSPDLLTHTRRQRCRGAPCMLMPPIVSRGHSAK